MTGRRPPPKSPPMPLENFPAYVAARRSHTEASQVLRLELRHLPPDLTTWPEVASWMRAQGLPRRVEHMAREVWTDYRRLVRERAQRKG